jgi:hypothetical protein
MAKITIYFYVLQRLQFAIEVCEVVKANRSVKIFYSESITFSTIKIAVHSTHCVQPPLVMQLGWIRNFAIRNFAKFCTFVKFSITKSSFHTLSYSIEHINLKLMLFGKL